MTHYKTLVDSDYLGQWDIPEGRRVVVEIEKVAKFKTDRLKAGEKNKRIAISMKGKRKRWLCGPVSQDTIASMYGPNIENWIGKRLELYVDANIMFGRSKVGGIRCSPTIPKGAATTEPLDEEVDEERAAMIEEAKGAVYDG